MCIHVFVCSQLRVAARDGAIIPCVKSAVLTVTVNRNVNAPVWITPTLYHVTLLETHNVLVPFYTLAATDTDFRVSHTLV